MCSSDLSAYRSGHSTETALLRLHNDLTSAVDKGEVGLLVLLDMSSAFDTVDHQTLVNIFRSQYAIDGAALGWFKSYLSDRTYRVRVGTDTSDVMILDSGLPQGSVLGPKSFIMYTGDSSDIFENRCVLHHSFADDMQCALCSPPDAADLLKNDLVTCVNAIRTWCSSRRLQLNSDKTEALWFGTTQKLENIKPADMNLSLHDGEDITPSEVLRDLGVYIDSRLSMKPHINRLARTCFFHLRRLRSIRNKITTEATATLVSTLILSRIDYCNSLLADLPASSLDPLRRVMNASARLVTNLKPFDRVTTVLQELHWLPVEFRIKYKLCLLTHLTLMQKTPPYLRELLTFIADMPGKSCLRSATENLLQVPRTRLKQGERAFSVSAPRIWNSLPHGLRLQSNTQQFKKGLKTFFYELAFKTHTN